MNTSRAGTWLTVLLILLTTRVASAQTPPPSAAPKLGGTRWQLVQFQGSDDTT